MFCAQAGRALSRSKIFPWQLLHLFPRLRSLQQPLDRIAPCGCARHRILKCRQFDAHRQSAPGAMIGQLSTSPKFLLSFVGTISSRVPLTFSTIVRIVLQTCADGTAGLEGHRCLTNMQEAMSDHTRRLWVAVSEPSMIGVTSNAVNDKPAQSQHRTTSPARRKRLRLCISDPDHRVGSILKSTPFAMCPL
jgi:hypothetical protein